MSEIRLLESVTVGRPADEVWRLVADYARDPEWRSGVRTMSPSAVGPVSAGVTTLEEVRFGGRTWRNAGEVVDVEDGQAFSWRTTSGTRACGARRVTPLGPGRSRVDLELVVVPGPRQRLLRPLLAAMLRRALRGDAGRLRQVAERSAGRPPVHPAT